MSGADFESLLKSPLEAPRADGGTRWYLLGGGLGFGVVLALLAILASGSSSESAGSRSDMAPAVSATSVATTVPDEPVEFVALLPDGYLPLTDDVGVKPVAAMAEGDGLLVSVAVAVRSGGDPAEVGRPLGATWLLERKDGSRMDASGLVADRVRPGIYSVQFPDSAQPGDALVMTERWDAVDILQEVTVPYTNDAPYRFPVPLTLQLTEDVAMLIEGQLGRFMGELSWLLEGSDGLLGIASVDVVLLDEAGEEIGGYGSDHGNLNPIDASDALQLFWLPDFPVDQTGAVEMLVRVRAQLSSRTVHDLRFELDGLPGSLGGRE